MNNILLAVRRHFLIGQLYSVQAFQLHSLSLLSIRVKYVAKVKVYTRVARTEHRANTPLAVVVNKMCLIKNKKPEEKREKCNENESHNKSKGKQSSEPERPRGVSILMN